MTQPRKNRSGTIVLIAVGALVLLCCGGGLAGYVVFGRSGTQASGGQAAASTRSADSFDQAAFDAYWQQWSGTSWGGQVTSIDRDSYGMTAHTKLFPKAENQQAALSICGAIMSYWGTGEAPAVRVLDQADNVLASRHTGEASCSWRR